MPRCGFRRRQWEGAGEQQPGRHRSTLGDELGNEPAEELANGAAQLVPDERLERLLRRGHALSLVRSCHNGLLRRPPSLGRDLERGPNSLTSASSP
jgi:hypothetical protein